MQDTDSAALDKLSSLAAELEAAERELGEVAADGLKEAREEVVAVLVAHREIVYRVVETLSRYRSFFKEKHMWLKILDRIAAARGCSAKTLRRLLSNYDKAQELEQVVVDEMLEQHIDPALPRNRTVVEMLGRDPRPKNREEAAAAVSSARSNLIAMTNPPKTDPEAGEPQSTEEFARRLARLVEPWYRGFPLEDRDVQLRYVLEKLVNRLRADVRELRIYSRPDQVRKPAVGGGR